MQNVVFSNYTRQLINVILLMRLVVVLMDIASVGDNNSSRSGLLSIWSKRFYETF